MTDYSRRIDMTRMRPVERILQVAMIMVEEMGADARLTDASVLIQQARDRVADFIDGVTPSASGGDEARCDECGGKGLVRREASNLPDECPHCGREP